MNKIRGKETNTNNKVLNTNKKKNIFSILQKNTTFVLQRHATSCANIINKGFKTGSTSNITFGKSRLVAEIAPDSMLSSVGIDECYQVHDYLTNVGTDIIELKNFDYLFCCSELFRTQQTMFLSYFELIRSNDIKIMILPWLNEERAIDTFGVVNKDNLTITLAETKLRWASFIVKTFKDNEPIIRKYSDWNHVFSLPDFIYRNPTGPEATFDKRVDLEKLYKIKMEESKIGLTRTKQSYNADDLLFALPFILYLSKKATDSQIQLKIFMTGHSRTMVKLINLITLRSTTSKQSKYYSKPHLEKQQMMNAEIIELESVKLGHIFGGRDDINGSNGFGDNNKNKVDSHLVNMEYYLSPKYPVALTASYELINYKPSLNEPERPEAKEFKLGIKYIFGGEKSLMAFDKSRITHQANVENYWTHLANEID